MVDNRTTTFSFAGFRTNWLRREEAMKTPGRENPTRWAAVPSDRDFGAAGQNRSRSIKWAAKQEKLQPKEMCFFLTSPFIEPSLVVADWILETLGFESESQLCT